MKQIIVDNIATNYFIDEQGRCYNAKTANYLKGQISNSGYLNYNISITPDNKRRLYAHRLVATAYLENPNNLPVVNHKDGNKLNNNVDNLEWVTVQENTEHAIRTGLIHGQEVYAFDKQGTLIHSFKSIEETSAAGFDRTSIWQELQKEKKEPIYNLYWSKTKDININNFLDKRPNTGKSKIVYQYTLQGEFLNQYSSTGMAAKALGLSSPSHIGECCRGKLKQYKGYIWKYAEDIVSTSNENQSSS